MSITRLAARAVAAGVASRSVSIAVRGLVVAGALRSAAPSSKRCLHTRSAAHAAAPTVHATPGATIDFNLADIGEGIAECEVLRWFVAEGDTIAQFDKVCEVQSDKANVEITSRYDGVITSLKYKVGDLAKVGKPLLSIKISGSSEGAPAAAAAPQAAASAAPAAAAAASAAAAAAVDSFTGAGGKALTSPAVRRIAKEENVNLGHVVATGPGGRILKEDVLNYLKGGRKAPAAAPAAAAKPCPVAAARAAAPVAAAAAPAAGGKHVQPVPQSLTEDVVIPITGINRIMVQTMMAANAIPQLGYSDEICFDALVDLRTLLNKDAAKHGVKLSYMPFVLKAASLALKQYPQLNAHANADCSTLTHKAAHNIGVAMDTPRGLLVPNVKDIANKSLLEIALEMQRLAKLGGEGKLGREDLQGGTFTLSNVGTIGGTYLKPILVVPEVVIGALGALQTLPRFDAHMNVKPTKILTISFSADHRVVDGATMARFSNLFKYYLEHPSSMLLATK